MVKHSETSENRKPPPGLKGKGQGICSQSPLRTGVLEAARTTGCCLLEIRRGRGAEQRNPRAGTFLTLQSQTHLEVSCPGRRTVCSWGTDQDRERKLRKANAESRAQTPYLTLICSLDALSIYESTVATTIQSSFLQF